jgi:hypothetical protein
MRTAMTTCRVTTFILTLAALGCSTESEPPPEPAGTFSDAYDPGRLIYATVNCDRRLTYAILDMNHLGDFDLSINVIDDCTRSGGGLGFGEVLMLGTYTRESSTLHFTPESGGTGSFQGTFDADSVRVTLPARTDSLAATDLQLRLTRAWSGLMAISRACGTLTLTPDPFPGAGKGFNCLCR